jgi:hypothetical protein
VKVNLTAGASNFTVPAGSLIAVSVSPNETLLSTAAMPTPPPLPSRYVGLPASLDAAVIHMEYPDVLMGFSGDEVHFHSIASEAVHRATGSVAALFPEVTGTIQYIHRASQKGTNGAGQTTFWNFSIYNTNLDYYKYEWGGGAIDNFVFQNSGNHSWLDYSASGEEWKLNFKEEGGVQKVDAVGNTGNFQPYGPGTALYPTLPNTAPVDAAVHDRVNDRVLVTIGSTMYVLNTTTNAVVESFTYG